MLVSIKKWLWRFRRLGSLVLEAPRGARANILRWNAIFLFNKICEKKTVLFECQQPRDWGFLDSVYRALRECSDIRCYVLVNDRPARIGGIGYDVDAVKTLLKSAGVDMSHVAQRLGSTLFFADFYLTPTTYCNFLPIDRSIVRGVMPHGLVNKRYPISSGFDQSPNQYGPEMSEFDVLLSTGPECTRTANTFRSIYGHKYVIWEVGYPKIDNLLTTQGAAHSQFSGQPLHVIYAPSWGKHTALDVYGLSPVQWAHDAGHSVTIKLHPMSLSSHNDLATGGVDWCKAIEPYRNLERVKVIDTAANDDVLRNADVMISDVSGIAYEFILMEKPVIFLDLPGFFHCGADIEGVDGIGDLSFWGRSYGRIVSNREEMLAAMDDYIHGRWMTDAVKELKRRLLFNPGCAGQAAASTIMEFCQKRRNQ
jgi:hypothetical protein